MAATAPSAPPAFEPLARRERFFRSVVPSTRLCCVSWPPAAGAPPARAAVLFVHGYGHYCAPLYDWLATTLAPRGVLCFALEHVGHGKSEGLRAYVPSMDGLVEDLLRCAAALRASREDALPPEVPFFAYGESLGGGMCILAALREPQTFSGLMLMSPMVGTSGGMVPPWPIVALGQAAALIAPTAAVAPVKEILPLCFRDMSMLPAARADPNRYSGRMRLRTAFELKDAIARLGARGAELALPLFVAHGTGDQVTSHAASERLLEACAARDRTFVTFEGAWHVLWAEPADTRVRLLAELTGWLDARCLGAGAVAPDFRRVAYPLSEASFGGDPGAATTPFSWSTHAHLVTRCRPVGELLHPDGGPAQSLAGALVARRLVAVGAAAGAVAAVSQGAFALGAAAAAVAGALTLFAAERTRVPSRS
jgi:acylglycerol lipase